MKRIENYDLGAHNTFGMKVKAALYIEYDSVDELMSLDYKSLPQPIFHIGAGSNLLFTKDFPGTVLHSNIKYIKYVDKSRWSTDQNNAKTLLKEVQTAVVDVQEQEKDPLAAAGTAATIVMNDTKTTATGISADLKTSLDGADNSWEKTKVTNKGKADGAKATFTITVKNDGQVTGVWN